VFPVLGALEALSGELACSNITNTEVAYIRQLHDQMMENYRDRNLADYFKINQEIHRAILLAAKNQSLTNTCQALSARMQRARYAANLSEERWANAVGEHEQIIRSLEAREGKQLGEILRQHMKNKQDSVLKWLRTTNAEQDNSAS
jgi:DNA-binding GntR family transcriptional regulator